MKSIKRSDKLELKSYFIYLDTNYLFTIVFFISECNFEVTVLNGILKLIRKFKP